MYISSTNFLVASQGYAKPTASQSASGQSASGQSASGDSFSLDSTASATKADAAAATDSFAPLNFKSVARDSVVTPAETAASANARPTTTANGYGGGAQLGSAINITV